MANSMYVNMNSLKGLRSELETALSNFSRSFSELETGINSLTQKGFIGEGAVVFKQTFEGQPKTILEEVKRDTRNAIDYMNQKIVSFERTGQEIDNISAGSGRY